MGVSLLSLRPRMRVRWRAQARVTPQGGESGSWHARGLRTSGVVRVKAILGPAYDRGMSPTDEMRRNAMNRANQ